MPAKALCTSADDRFATATWCMQVLETLDRQPTPTAALEQALRGVFAGNIFDLGAAASAQRYESGQGAGFHCALDQLLPRPWVRGSLFCWYSMHYCLLYVCVSWFAHASMP